MTNGSDPAETPAPSHDPAGSLCLCCAAPATLLCDHVLGFQIVATLPTPVTDGSAMWTCDAPLCSQCATHAGNVFVCGDEAHGDSVDHCPEHVGNDEGLPITAADAEYLRRKVWALLRRRCIRRDAAASLHREAHPMPADVSTERET